MSLTSVDIPDDLMEEVQMLTHQTTKRGAVIVSMQELAQRRRQRRAVEALATMEFLEDIGDPDVRAKARA